jgi:hypothetical protein
MGRRQAMGRRCTELFVQLGELARDDDSAIGASGSGKVAKRLEQPVRRLVQDGGATLRCSSRRRTRDFFRARRTTASHVRLLSGIAG